MLRLCSAGDYSGAIESYLAAAKVDDRYADLQFRLGRCYWETGDYEKARDRFLLSRGRVDEARDMQRQAALAGSAEGGSR